MGKIEEKKGFYIRKSLTENLDKKEDEKLQPIDPKEMTPYQKHMKYNRFKSTVMDKNELAERKKMQHLMQQFIRNKKFSKMLKKQFGDDFVQPQALNIELCYEEQFSETQKIKGLKEPQKLGDIIMNTSY